MNRSLSRTARAIILGLGLVLSACGGGDAGFTGATPVSYDGVWRGLARYESGGQRNCPAPTPFVLTITNSTVHGEVRDRNNRDATVARFDAVVDADGRLTARAWYDSIANDIALEFNGTRFSGSITNPNECKFYLRLSRD
jgi:hypothetical protein